MRQSQTGRAVAVLSIAEYSRPSASPSTSPRFLVEISVDLFRQLCQFIVVELSFRIRLRDGICFICICLYSYVPGRDWLGQAQAGRTGGSLFLGKPVQGDLIQKAAACCRQESGSTKLGTSSPCTGEMARRRWERATRPQECVKSHRACAQFAATWHHWDGQKREPACKKMLGRRICIRI